MAFAVAAVRRDSPREVMTITVVMVAVVVVLLWVVVAVVGLRSRAVVVAGRRRCRGGW